MKIILPSHEILTEISDDGINELQRIERAARICYKSEDRITEDGESARTLVGKLIKNGHEAMLEHSDLSVKFIVDRGISHELVRHRLCSFAQESTRWCNYANGKFDGQLTFIMPLEFNTWFMKNADLDSYSVFRSRLEHGENLKQAFYEYVDANSMRFPSEFFNWFIIMEEVEDHYMAMVNSGCTPQLARSILPNSLKTELVVTANYREWRNIFKLRTAPNAHPDMRIIMAELLNDVHSKIPVVFDDIVSGIDWNSIEL